MTHQTPSSAPCEGTPGEGHRAATGDGNSASPVAARTNALTAKAAQWDQDAKDQQQLTEHWDSEGEDRLAGVARGRARQAADCAAELRALIAKETGQ